MKRLIGCMALLCLVALMAACGVQQTGALAYVNNASPSGANGFSVLAVNQNGTLIPAAIGNQGAGATKLIQISPNGLFAYYLDSTGTQLVGYLHAANGTLWQPIQTVGLNAPATSLAISADSQFLYVAIPGEQTGALAVYFINQGNGQLTEQGGQDQVIGYPLSQLVIWPQKPTPNNPPSVLYGLSPAKGQVVGMALDSTGLPKGLPIPAVVGSAPPTNGMILSADGKYLYALDSQLTSTYKDQAGITGQSPVFFGFTTCVANNTCSTAPGVLSAMGGLSGGVFHENSDLVLSQLANTPVFPSEPVAGATSGDGLFLFIANKGSQDISVFDIHTLPGGEPLEISGPGLVNVGGITMTTQSPFQCNCSPDYVATTPLNPNFVYVLDTNAASIFQFTEQSTGVLRPLTPASVNVGGLPQYITMH